LLAYGTFATGYRTRHSAREQFLSHVSGRILLGKVGNSE
jgi:hypothetical protein